MTQIPAQLTKAFSEVDQGAIAAWWSTLSDAHRDEVARLCDTRADSCFFGVVADELESPEVERGLCDEDDVRPVDEWAPSHFEYLLNHPELVLIWDQTERTFHVGCTAHADAQACWRSGEVPGGFACPFGRWDCLMRPLLGRRVRWRGVHKTRDATTQATLMGVGRAWNGWCSGLKTPHPAPSPTSGERALRQ